MKFKGLKMILTIMALIVLSAFLFVACAPQLGSASNGEHVQSSAHYKEGKFFNPVKTSVSTSSGKMLDSTIEYLTGKQQREPETILPARPIRFDDIGKTDNLKVTWLGHSTALIEVDGKVILTDPMFSERASPFSFMGPKRFSSELQLDIKSLPKLDAIVISHDHYDHLDHQSIIALKDKADHFYVPLGVDGHLKRWGVPEDKITALDWWEDAGHDTLTFVATPARHFSGRGLVRNKTLWASWVIKGKSEKVFFGGDSGYFDGFKEIGDKYGPFDITMLESGAYNEAWSEIHMMPEETVQAHIDLQGKVLLPIHWGKFNLSIHSWTEPIERLVAEGSLMGINATTPAIGQAVIAGSRFPQEKWWDLLKKKP